MAEPEAAAAGAGGEDLMAAADAGGEGNLDGGSAVNGTSGSTVAAADNGAVDVAMAESGRAEGDADRGDEGSGAVGEGAAGVDRTSDPAGAGEAAEASGAGAGSAQGGTEKDGAEAWNNEASSALGGTSSGAAEVAATDGERARPESGASWPVGGKSWSEAAAGDSGKAEKEAWGGKDRWSSDDKWASGQQKSWPSSWEKQQGSDKQWKSNSWQDKGADEWKSWNKKDAWQADQRQDGGSDVKQTNRREWQGPRDWRDRRRDEQPARVEVDGRKQQKRERSRSPRRSLADEQSTMAEPVETVPDWLTHEKPSEDPLVKCLPHNLRKQVPEGEPGVALAYAFSLREDSWPALEVIGGGSNGNPDVATLQELSHRLLDKIVNQANEKPTDNLQGLDQVGYFVRMYSLSSATEAALRSLPEVAKRRVIGAGPIVGYNKNVVAMTRAKKALEGLHKKEQSAKSFLHSNWVGSQTIKAFQQAAPEVQEWVMQKGPLLGPCPSRTLLERIEKAEKKLAEEQRQREETAAMERPPEALSVPTPLAQAPPTILPPGAATPELFGGAATPQLYGGAATPQLYGGAATPQLYGGAATPQLYGGAATPQRYGGAATPQRYGGATTPVPLGAATPVLQPPAGAATPMWPGAATPVPTTLPGWATNGFPGRPLPGAATPLAPPTVLPPGYDMR